MKNVLIPIVLILIVGFGAEIAGRVGIAKSAEQKSGAASATGAIWREHQIEITSDKTQTQRKPSSTSDAPVLADVKRQKLILLILLSLGQNRNTLH